ncbi:MAG: hypothetical protein H3C59_13995 [Burkholderiaceae bacterium]|nr:hypothetical protein [Burkholderiaceae bacterium]
MITKALIDHADIALIDVTTAVSFGDMSESWWYAEVAAGRAPAPVVRRPRCTRWRLFDVLQFWKSFAAAPDDGSAERVAAHARRASNAASVKRAAGREQGAAHAAG